MRELVRRVGAGLTLLLAALAFQTFAQPDSGRQGPDFIVRSTNPFPLYDQQDAANTGIYRDNSWAKVVYGGKPRSDETCLAVVLLMIEHARGNTDHRIGREIEWDDSVGVSRSIPGVNGGLASNKPFDGPDVAAQLRAGNPVILQTNSFNGIPHFILAVGIDASGKIIAHDPMGGLRIKVDPISGKVSGRPSRYTINNYRLVDFAGGASSGSRSADYTDIFLGDSEVEVRVTSEANQRNFPSTIGTKIVATLGVDTMLKGRWVRDMENDRRWLKVGSGGYVWDGNLAIQADPIDYCARVGTEPAPNAEATISPAMLRSAGITEQDAAYGSAWRCDGGRVLVCGITDMHYVSCSPRLEAIHPASEEYCRENPNESFIPMSHALRSSVFELGCRGRKVVVLKRWILESDLDLNGFYKDEWKYLPTSAREPQTRDPANRITTDGMFGVTAGMRVDAISYRLDMSGVYGSQMDNWDASQCEVYNSKNGEFSVLTENGIIGSILTVSSEVETVSGARVGMTSDQLRSIYGAQLQREGNPYVEPPGADYFVYSSTGNGVKFSVGEDDRVQSITAGGSAIQLVEGCL